MCCSELKYILKRVGISVLKAEEEETISVKGEMVSGPVISKVMGSFFPTILKTPPNGYSKRAVPCGLLQLIGSCGFCSGKQVLSKLNSQLCPFTHL